jgi:hypothetical protein
MKKIIFGLLATVMFGFVGTSQTSKKEWLSIMKTHKTKVDEILLLECPRDIELNKFKHQIIEGKVKLSEKTTIKLKESANPIKKYAQEFTNKHNIKVDSEEELIFYAGFDPDFNFSDDTFNSTSGITAGEVWDCAVDAIGLGFASAIGSHAIKELGIRIFTQAITKFIVKFAGPIGAIITAADFAFCLNDAAQN